MAERRVRLTEPRSGLDAEFRLLDEVAPENAAFLWGLLRMPLLVEALHAMWTGPEISMPIPFAAVTDAGLNVALPPENSTVHPAAGDLVLTYLPPRMWGGSPTPIFDLGLFYDHGGRTFFPIGWIPGSVCARLDGDPDALRRACATIRRLGAVHVRLERVTGRA